MDVCHDKSLEEGICVMQVAAWSFKVSLLPTAEGMLRRLQQGPELKSHQHRLCQRQVQQTCCSLHSAQLRGHSSPERHHCGCAKDPAPCFETIPSMLSRPPHQPWPPCCAAAASLVSTSRQLCMLNSSGPVCAPLNDMDVAGPQVRQPPLQLFCPHQTQAGWHNDQQGPLFLQARQRPYSAGRAA